MSRVLYALAGMCVRHRFRVAAAWLVLVVAFVVVANSVGKETSNNLTLPGTGSTQAQDLLQDNLPKQANGTIPVVMETSSGHADRRRKTSRPSRRPSSRSSRRRRDRRAVSPLSSEGAERAHQGREDRLHLGDPRRQPRRPLRGRGERRSSTPTTRRATPGSRSRRAATWARRSPSLRPSRAR